MSTARITTYGAAVVEHEGQSFGMGPLNTPVGDAEFTFGAVAPVRRSVAPAFAAGIFGSPTSTARLEYIALRIIGEGTLIISSLLDKPTDAANDDWTPLGTQRRWDHENWTCEKGIWQRNTDVMVGHDTVATEYGDNAGQPTLWTTGIAGMITKKLYAVYVFNNESTAIEFEAFLVQKEA